MARGLLDCPVKPGNDSDWFTAFPIHRVRSYSPNTTRASTA
jgi:hypothetical protein